MPVGVSSACPLVCPAACPLVCPEAHLLSRQRRRSGQRLREAAIGLAESDPEATFGSEPASLLPASSTCAQVDLRESPATVVNLCGASVRFSLLDQIELDLSSLGQMKCTEQNGVFALKRVGAKYPNTWVNPRRLVLPKRGPFRFHYIGAIVHLSEQAGLRSALCSKHEYVPCWGLGKSSCQLCGQRYYLTDPHCNSRDVPFPVRISEWSFVHTLVVECHYLTDLKPLTQMGMHTLHLKGLVSDFTGLETCVNLRTLKLSTCSSIGVLPSATAIDFSKLGSCTGLKELQILLPNRAPRDFEFLAKLTQLSHINIMGIGTDVSYLARFSELESLILEFDPTVSCSIPSLRACTELSDFHVSCNSALIDLDCTASNSRLRTVKLVRCPELQTVSSLGICTELQTVLLQSCPIVEVSALVALTHLEVLDIIQCNSLTAFSDMDGFEGLKTLRISNCQSLASFSRLGGFGALQRLSLSNNQSLTAISDLRGFECLFSGVCLLDRRSNNDLSHTELRAFGDAFFVSDCYSLQVCHCMSDPTCIDLHTHL